MKHYSQNRALVSACVLLLMATAGWSQSLRWLGVIRGFQSSIAYDVSADGSVVVGVSSTGGGFSSMSHAFRWTADGGMQDLGTLGGHRSIAYGVSADGSMVIGWSYNASLQERAFRWTAGGGMQDIGSLTGGSKSWAYDVSANGSVIVGVATNAGGYDRAVRWTQLGIQNLGAANGWYSRAYGVSLDGSIVVGETDSRAFLWTRSSGIQILPLPEGYAESVARGVSANGVVVGVVKPRGGSGGFNIPKPCKWVNGIPIILNTIDSNWQSEAYAVSEDGSVIVGTMTTSQGNRACRWTEAGGLEVLSQTYARLLGPDSRLEEARAVSPDGRFIVGRGFNENTWRTEAFLLDTRCTPHNGDVNRDGCVDDRDLLTVLFEFGETGIFDGVDTNCDQVIDDADLLVVLFNFGQGC